MIVKQAKFKVGDLVIISDDCTATEIEQGFDDAMEKFLGTKQLIDDVYIHKDSDEPITYKICNFFWSEADLSIEQKPTIEYYSKLSIHKKRSFIFDTSELVEEIK
jgi:hypothetical protein